MTIEGLPDSTVYSGQDQAPAVKRAGVSLEPSSPLEVACPFPREVIEKAVFEAADVEYQHQFDKNRPLAFKPARRMQQRAKTANSRIELDQDARDLIGEVAISHTSYELDKVEANLPEDGRLH